MIPTGTAFACRLRVAQGVYFTASDSAIRIMQTLLPSAPGAALIWRSTSSRPATAAAVAAAPLPRGTPAYPCQGIRRRSRVAVGATSASHWALLLDGKARLALPQGSSPAEGEFPISHCVWAFLGCFCSMALFGVVDQYVLAPAGVPWLMGSFGTISVLYFGVGLKAPFLRVWNVVAGHVAAAAFALLCLQCLQPLWLARAVALASTVAFMLWTGSVHPPGGALVMILCDSAKFQALGVAYLIYPGALGAMLLMVFARITDELKRRFVFSTDDIARLLMAPLQRFQERTRPPTALN